MSMPSISAVSCSFLMSLSVRVASAFSCSDKIYPSAHAAVISYGERGGSTYHALQLPVLVLEVELEDDGEDTGDGDQCNVAVRVSVCNLTAMAALKLSTHIPMAT